jgi:type II secretory pathway component GspD/PulD (secretin)
MTIDSEEGKVLESGLMSDVRVTADANGNALVITGPSKSMGLIGALVKELDTLPSARAQIKVFTIVNGDASALSSMLQQLLGQQAQGTQQAFGTLFGQGAINPFLQPALQSAASIGESSLVPIRFGVDQRTNSIIVTGSEGDLGVVEAILLRLDEESFREHKTAVYWLANAPALSVADSLNTWLDERDQLFANQLQISPESPDIQWNRQVIVVPEEISNSIIISAVPELFDEVKHVIESLDRSQPLVKIDVLIAEVALTDLYEFGAEFGLQDSLLFDRDGAVFNFNNVPLGDTGGNRNRLGAQALSAFGLGRVSPNEGYGGLVLSASKDSVSVLIRALQEDGRIQILSRPQVMTMDKQPATVFVGENTARPGATTQGTATTVTSVNYEDVGLQLLVTPQVNPDGTVKMDIEATKSRIDEARSVTIDGNEIPNIVTVNAVATISAASGQTVVFAGLIQTNKQQELRGIPYVSRLPVVGPLLSYTEDRDVRSELLIIMTPHVVHDNDEDQIATINYTESERMSWCLADVVDLYGDVGLSARPGWWCEGEWRCFHRAPVIFPAENPTGLEPTPVPMPVEDQDEVELPPVPVEPTSSRRTHQPDVNTNNQAAMGVAPIPSVAPPYYHPRGPRASAYPDVPAAHVGPPNVAVGRAGFRGPREVPGGPEGRSRYQTNPEPYQAHGVMPMAQ